MKKESSGEFITDFEQAKENFNVPVNCGKCYVWYDIAIEDFCPLCGSDEIVGNKHFLT